MKREETLQGRGSFQLLYRSGKRVEGEVLRCFFRWESGAGTHVRAGFSVSAKKYNAVKRNRARRLMRAAYQAERDLLAGAAEKTGAPLSVVFVYVGGKEEHRVRIAFEGVRRDMSSLCGKVRATAGKGRT